MNWMSRRLRVVGCYWRDLQTLLVIKHEFKTAWQLTIWKYSSQRCTPVEIHPAHKQVFSLILYRISYLIQVYSPNDCNLSNRCELGSISLLSSNLSRVKCRWGGQTRERDLNLSWMQWAKAKGYQTMENHTSVDTARVSFLLCFSLFALQAPGYGMRAVLYWVAISRVRQSHPSSGRHTRDSCLPELRFQHQFRSLDKWRGFLEDSPDRFSSYINI